uniref:Treble clef zinc finger domain-containing protein n=1 Tax=viral metagenome TaxID=1070528 RepID=A0A6C0K4Z5_9ZZZZ
MTTERRSFDKSLLDTCIAAEKAKLIGDYPALTRNSDITFQCSCGVQPSPKNFRQLVKTGAKCNTCTLIRKSERRATTCMERYKVPHPSMAASVKETQGNTFRTNLLKTVDSFAITHPDLLKEWDYTKNTKAPTEFTAGSNKAVWWKCANVHACGCAHEWEAILYSRTGLASGCPYCSNTRICIHNSILTTHPEVASQWHPIKNGDLTPDQVSRYSDREVWWLCPATCIEGCPHEFKSSVGNRTNGNGCPYCCKIVKKHCIHTSIVTTHPLLMKEWHLMKNTLRPETVGYGSHLSVWWKCAADHEWEAVIYARAMGNGCPHCKHKTEKKLFAWLQARYSTKAQVKYKWCVNADTKRGLPFDFEVQDRILLELHGRQHFQQISNWRSPEAQKERDDYKVKCALENGKHVICMDQEDVWNDVNDWESKLSQTIVELLACTVATNRDLITRYSND